MLADYCLQPPVFLKMLESNSTFKGAGMALESAADNTWEL
jgi:hypothetical protein